MEKGGRRTLSCGAVAQEGLWRELGVREVRGLRKAVAAFVPQCAPQVQCGGEYAGRLWFGVWLRRPETVELPLSGGLWYA